MSEKKLLINDKLFIIYSLVMRKEKEDLSKSQFNDLSVNDLHIMHIISLKKDITISQIAKMMTVSKAALTGNIDKLERLGYIQRVPSKTDRRVTNIAFTRRGRLLTRLHNRAHVAFGNALLKNATLEEKNRLNEVLDSLIEKLESSNDSVK